MCLDWSGAPSAVAAISKGLAIHITTLSVAAVGACRRAAAKTAVAVVASGIALAVGARGVVDTLIGNGWPVCVSNAIGPLVTLSAGNAI